MTISYAVFWFTTEPPALRALLVAALMLGSALFIVTRPEPDA